MKRRIIATLLIVLSLVTVTGCGNKQVFDFKRHFHKAIVKFPDDTVRELEVERWNDYEGEQLQIITPDGEIFLVNSVNCVLIGEE